MESKTSAGYGIVHTLEETARFMGITRERVRQLEKRALEKLKIQLRDRFGITDVSQVLG